LFAWPSLLGLLPAVRLRPFLTRGLAFSASVVCLGVPLLAFERTPAPPVSVSEYEPDFVRVLDHDAGQYGIRYGLAGYWQARLITLLSRTGLRAYPVDGSLNPLLFASNREWFTQSLEDHSRKPCLSFIVLNDPLWKLTRQMAVSHAGEPSYEFDAAGVPVMVYANGTPGHATPRCEAVSVSPAASGNGNAGVDRPLSRYVSSMSSPTTEIRAKPSEQMSIPLRIGNIGAELWSSTGKFPVTLSYKWLKSGRMLPIEGERTLLPGVVAPGAAVSVSAVVIAPPELGSYVLRFSLVQEGVTWFISSGAVPLDLPVTVSPVTGTQPR